MKFSELTECPFCGCDEFYTTQYVYGTIRYNERYDGEEAENAELYDGLNCKNYSGRAYCRNCNKYLGNRESNILSKAAEELLCKPTSANAEKPLKNQAKPIQQDMS